MVIWIWIELKYCRIIYNVAIFTSIVDKIVIAEFFIQSYWSHFILLDVLILYISMLPTDLVRHENDSPWKSHVNSIRQIRIHSLDSIPSLSYIISEFMFSILYIVSFTYIVWKFCSQNYGSWKTIASELGHVFIKCCSFCKFCSCFVYM